MSFDVPADAYGRFMGRYSGPLAPAFADLVGARHGQRALDVGCGPGALTRVLVDRLGGDQVHALDPSPSFVAALTEGLPGVAVSTGGAESIPYEDGSFDLVLAQLVVQFMSDPVAGLAEMARVARPGATVAASVWDHGTGRGPLSLFWRAARELDPAVPGESGQDGVSEGSLVGLFEAAGMAGTRGTTLTVRVEHATFEEWWAPYTLGVGPAGAYVQRLDAARQEALRERCRSLQGPQRPVVVEAVAWVAVWDRPAADPA